MNKNKKCYQALGLNIMIMFRECKETKNNITAF